MKQRFLKEGYPWDFVEVAYHMGLQKLRHAFLQKRKRNMFSTTYIPNWHKLGFTIENHWHIISSDQAMSMDLKEPP